MCMCVRDQVSTLFDITRLKSSSVFSCSECNGVISPEEVYKFKVYILYSLLCDIMYVTGDVSASVSRR